MTEPLHHDDAEKKSIIKAFAARARKKRGAQARLRHHYVGRICWCRPILVVPCPECQHEPGYMPLTEGNDCWQCNGSGCLPADGQEPDCITVHNDDRENQTCRYFLSMFQGAGK